MNKQEIIQATEKFVRETLADADGSHDWWHIYRVWKSARHIAQLEKADMFVVELGALLHDIADFKFNNGDEEIGPRKAREFLQAQGLDEEVVRHVEQIVANVSFKGGMHKQEFKTLELDVVQDADRLDALGAIGVARTFAYGGFKKKEIYNPEIPPNLNMTKEEYKNNNSSSINHFYEKLLLLKDLMNTATGKKMAVKRHEFMELFLKHFFSEWEGKE